MATAAGGVRRGRGEGGGGSAAAMEATPTWAAERLPEREAADGARKGRETTRVQVA